MVAASPEEVRTQSEATQSQAELCLAQRQQQECSCSHQDTGIFRILSVNQTAAAAAVAAGNTLLWALIGCFGMSWHRCSSGPMLRGLLSTESRQVGASGYLSVTCHHTCVCFIACMTDLDQHPRLMFLDWRGRVIGFVPSMDRMHSVSYICGTY